MKNIFALAIVLVLVGAGCVSQEPVEQTPITNTPEENPATSTPNTATTTVKNPTTTPTKPVVVDPIPFGFTRAESNQLKFKIDYPTVWKEDKQVEDPQAAFRLHLDARVGDGSTLAIAVFRVVPEKGVTQATYNARIKKTLESYPKSEGEDYSLTTVEFAGQKDALKLISTNTKDMPRYAETYIIVRNEIAYILSYQASDEKYSGDLPMFKRMADSLRLK